MSHSRAGSILRHLDIDEQTVHRRARDGRRDGDDTIHRVALAETHRGAFMCLPVGMEAGEILRPAIARGEIRGGEIIQRVGEGHRVATNHTGDHSWLTSNEFDEI